MIRYLLTLFILCYSLSLNAIDKTGEPLKSKFEKSNTDAARLYKYFNYNHIWLEKGKWNKRASNLLEAIAKSADKEGLNSQEYSKLEELMKKEFPDEADQNKADMNVTSILIEYAYDLFKGRLRHLKVVSVKLGNPEYFDIIDYLIAKFKEEENGDFLGSMTLEVEGYQRLKKLLASYRTAIDSEEWPNFPEGLALKSSGTSSKKKGQNSTLGSKEKERIKILRTILIAQGDLKDKDSAKNTDYDEELVRAVESFQKRHNIEVDGVVGPETATMLNLSHKDKIDRILLTMERWRWLPKKMEGRYVIVNIPQFQLSAYDDGKKAFDMNIIVGKQYRKTPTFSSEVYEVRFNPSWHVPPGIFRKDKLPKIMEDPSYIAQKGFVVYDALTGQRRDPNSVAWGSDDVKLVQPPGSKNALGKIRFTLKTTNDVYLHGTPEQNLFQKTKRVFSSGCIRVENPQKLALYMFNDEEKWPLKKIEAECAKSSTINVPLKQAVPVHIVYLTVWVDGEGNGYFADDVYGRDRVLIEQLRQIHYPGYIAQVDISELDKEDQEEPSEPAVAEMQEGAETLPEQADTDFTASPSFSNQESYSLQERNALSSDQPYGRY